MGSLNDRSPRKWLHRAASVSLLASGIGPLLVGLVLGLLPARTVAQTLEWRAASGRSGVESSGTITQSASENRPAQSLLGASSSETAEGTGPGHSSGARGRSGGSWSRATTVGAAPGGESPSVGLPVTLPASAGQIWREYDIRVYTSQVQTTKRPEVAVLDWILRETGYEVWHGEVPALLSVGKDKVLVFHTPEVQEVVADVIRRFTTNGAEPVNMSVRLIVVSNPGWQASWMHALTPVRVHSPGIKAWVLYREDASLLVADLRRRPDYREHHAPQLAVPNGQLTVVSATRARPYTKYLSWRPETWPGFSPETAFVDEGFTLEISPLLSVDRQQVDVVLRLEATQIERLVPLVLEMGGGPGQPSRPRLEVPQRVQCSFHERFRWSVEQALLVDLGMAPVPIPVESNVFTSWLFPLSASAPRGNVLILLELRSASAATAQVPSPSVPAPRPGKSY